MVFYLMSSIHDMSKMKMPFKEGVNQKHSLQNYQAQTQPLFQVRKAFHGKYKFIAKLDKN